MIDTSFLVGNAPTPLLSPYERQIRQNALAQQAIALHEQQQAAQDQAATRAGLQSFYNAQAQPGAPPPPQNALAAAAPAAAPAGPTSVVKDPVTGVPLPSAAPYTPPPVQPQAAQAQPMPTPTVARPRTPTVAELVNQFHVPVESAQATVAAFQKVDQGAAELDKTHADAQKARGEYAGLLQEQGANAADAIVKSGFNPGVVQHQLDHFRSLGPEASAQVDSLLSSTQGDPARFQALVQSMADAGKGNREANAAVQTANAHMLTSQATAAKDAAELPGIQADSTQKTVSVAANDLSNAMNSKDYDARLAALKASDPELAKKFPAAGTWTAATRGQLVKMSLTGEQKTTADETATRDANTAANERTARGQEQQRIGIEQQRLVVQRLGAGLDAKGNPITASNANPTAVAIAGGKLDPASARAILRRDPGLYNQVLAVDPRFDEAKLENRYAFNKRLTDYSPTEIGGQALALNKLVHHADLLYDTVDALRNHSLVPGNQLYNAVSTTFGGVPAGNFDTVRDFVVHEAAKLAQGGVPNEADIKQSIKNLNSAASPEQLKERLGKVLEVAGGGMEAINEQGRQFGMGDNFTVLGNQGRSIMQRRNIDPNTFKPVAPAAASPAPARAAVPTGLQHMSTPELLKLAAQ